MHEPSYVREARLAQQRFDNNNPVQLEIGGLMPLFEEDIRKVGLRIDNVLRDDYRLKYDGNVDHGIELIYSARESGEQYRITIIKETNVSD